MCIGPIVHDQHLHASPFPMGYLVIGVVVILVQIIDRISPTGYPLGQNRIHFTSMLEHIGESKGYPPGMQLVKDIEQRTLLNLIPTRKPPPPVVVRSCGDKIGRIAINQIAFAQPREVEPVEIASGKGNIPFVQTSDEG